MDQRRYLRWYAETTRNATIRLDLPAFQAITTPAIEARSEKTKARSLADILERKCDEFRLLLDVAKREEELQVWLKQTDNLMFFGADAEWVVSKMKYGTRFVSDFVVKRPTKPYLLVEIETTEKIFNSDSSKSRRFNQARQQVLDWQTWIGDNIDFFRKETRLEDVYKPEGLVVMGRSNDITKPLAIERWRELRAKADPSAITFDDMITRVRTVIKQLKAFE